MREDDGERPVEQGLCRVGRRKSLARVDEQWVTNVFQLVENNFVRQAVLHRVEFESVKPVA